MTTSMPAGPAIGLFAIAAAALAATGRLTEKGIDSAQQLASGAVRPADSALAEALGGASADPDLAELVDAGLLPPEFARPVAGTGNAGPGAAAAADQGRPPGWVYPAFEEPEAGLHGPGAAPRPRNIRLTLVGLLGEPFDPARLTAVQNGPDGRHELFGHRAHVTLPEERGEGPRTVEGLWILGSPSLTSGRAASFEVRAERDGEPWVGEFDLFEVPLGTDIEVGLPVEMRPAHGR